MSEMESYIVKVEPGLEHFEVHEYNIIKNYKEESLNIFKPGCINKESEVQPQQQSPIISETSNTNKNRTQNKVIKKITGKKQFEENAAPLTTYLKKRILKHFIEKDCTSRSVDKFVNEYKVSREVVKEYFGRAAQDAQEFVHQECDSLSFSNITEWLKHFEESGIHHDSNYESAIIMNVIVNNESHPDPETMGGVNLKSIYKFVSNALMGLPQKQLDSVSAKFLSNEFQNLINEANTDEADNDVRTMKIRLETAPSLKIDNQQSSLDPLKLTDDGELLRICQSAYIQSNSDNINIVKTEK